MSIPFVCLHCRRTFATNGSLKTHIRTHTGEKPYECPDCHNRFAQLANCTRHIRLMHVADAEDIVQELVRVRSLAKQAKRSLKKRSSVCSPCSSSSSSPMTTATAEDWRFPSDGAFSLRCEDFALLEEDDESLRWSFDLPLV